MSMSDTKLLVIRHSKCRVNHLYYRAVNTVAWTPSIHWQVQWCWWWQTVAAWSLTALLTLFNTGSSKPIPPNTYMANIDLCNNHVAMLDQAMQNRPLYLDEAFHGLISNHNPTTYLLLYNLALVLVMHQISVMHTGSKLHVDWLVRLSTASAWQ
jgi:hypothetical protein